MQPKSSMLTRRLFLKSTALAGAAVLGAPAFVRALGANERLNIAMIGVGGRGGHNLGHMTGENIVALCDVNETNLLKAAQKAPKAKQFRDFRKLYDDLKDGDFDAVVVSTTEHTHAAATMPALRRKKHVYCEKPLTLNVREARAITQAAAEAKVVTQMGTQMHASANYHRVVELIQAGAIGPVHEVHVWVSRAWGRQSEEEAKKHDRGGLWTWERPKETMKVPSWLDWDLWLGPAPVRPYHDRVYVPGPNWYRWWDFGNGTMSDLGSHRIDLPFWALQLDAPRSIEPDGTMPHAELAPATMRVTYEYGPRGNLPPVKLSWYQGLRKPELWEAKKVPQYADGVLFIGAQGMLIADYRQHKLLPEAKFADFKRPPQSISDSLNQHQEWLQACKTGGPTGSNFAYAGLLTEANHLGNVAHRAGRRIEWDAKNLRIPNAPDAEQFLGREYRKGWTLA